MWNFLKFSYKALGVLCFIGFFIGLVLAQSFKEVYLVILTSEVATGLLYLVWFLFALILFGIYKAYTKLAK